MRTNTRDAARRAQLVFARGVLMAADDKHMMQQVQARGLYGELHPAVERFQPVGFSSVPLPPDKDGNAAEVLLAYANSNHSHPIVIGVDDRRTRPKDMKPGDVVMYHHAGASQKFTDDGFTHDMGANKKPMNWITGKGSVKIEDGKVTVANDKATVTVEGSVITMTMGSSKVIVKDGVVSIVANKVELGAAGASMPVMLAGNVPSTVVFASG